MKAVLLILIFIGFTSCKKDSQFVKVAHIPSKLDSLNEQITIQDYIHTIDSNYNYFVFKPLSQFKGRLENHVLDSTVRAIAYRKKIDKIYYKADFDNNGYTDMLVIGDHDYCKQDLTCHYATAVLMNFGKDSIRISNLVKSLSFYDVPVPEIIYTDSVPLIKLYTKYKDSIREKLLVYKYDGFVEVNNKPAKHTIEKIQFATGGCFGKCPVFQVTVSKDRSAMFLAEFYNFSKSHDEENSFLTTVITQDTFDALVGLLNYMDFESLKNEYAVMWTDDASAKLVITYDGGKTKTINDYGLTGSYSLTVLYSQLYDLRFNQNWKKAPEPKGVRIKPY